MKSFAPACLVLAATLGGCAATPERVALSGIEPSYFDPAVKPGDDFFRYANGGWLARTPIPADRTAYGIDYLLADALELQLRGIIESPASAAAPAGSEAQQVADLYASFMDEARLQQLGLAPLQTELARIDALRSRDELPAQLAQLQRLGVDAFFGSYVHQDAKDSTQYVIDYVQSGLGLPDRDYYLVADEKFTQLRRQYREHIARTLAMAGIKDAEDAAREVMALERRLAQKQWTQVDSRDATKTYNRMTLGQVDQLMRGFDFAGFLQASGVQAQQVVVSQPSYFGALDIILRETPLATLKLYLKQRLLDEYAPYLHAEAEQGNFAFYGQALNGLQAQKPRWKRGVDLIDGALGEALGRIYVEKYFPPEHKRRMQALVQNLLRAFDQEAGQLAWMSAPTRQAARAKLATFVAKIGYPESWRDYRRLSIVSGDLVGNVMRAQAFEVQRNLDKLGQPIDRAEWGMTPQTINAYYNPEQNEIVFPAAILQPPYFNIAADDAVNYGAIGAVIGHEISHGFDDQGSKYDPQGNLKDWWQPEDRQKFEALTQRLVKQYDQYEPVKGFHINGELTLGENIADLAGAVIAYRAWQLSLGGKPSPVIDGYSGAQRFWLGYARSWMTQYREQRLINLVKSDPHAPAEYRVNGVVTHLPEFHEAFNVQPGQRLYRTPEQRVRIW